MLSIRKLEEERPFFEKVLSDRTDIELKASLYRLPDGLIFLLSLGIIYPFFESYYTFDSGGKRIMWSKGDHFHLFIHGFFNTFSALLGILTIGRWKTNITSWWIFR